MFAQFIHSVRRHLGLSSARSGPRRRSTPPRLERLEDRWAPAATPLVVTSYFDSAIYELNQTTGKLMQTLVAPNSQSVLQGPAGLTVGPDGNLYISSQLNDSIVEYNIESQTLSTFIDSSALDPIASANGDATFAPAGLAFGPDGNLYVSLNGGQQAVAGSGAVVRFDISNSNGTLSYSGTNSTISTGLDQPAGVAFGVAPNHECCLYVADSGDNRVVMIFHAANYAMPMTMDAVPAGMDGLSDPVGVTWHNGQLYVVDVGSSAQPQGEILRFSVDSGGMAMMGRVVTKSPRLDGAFPAGAVFNSAGDLLTADLGPTYPASDGGPGTSGSIAEFNPAGTFLGNLTRTSFPANPTTHVTNFSPSQMTLDIGDVAPTASAGGPYTVNESSSLTLKAVASDPQGYPLSYSWDVNGDLTYGDALGRSPTLSWAQLTRLGVDAAGTYSVSVQISDGRGQVVTSAPVTLTVNYVAPKVGSLVVASFFDSAIYAFNLSTGAPLGALVAPNSQSLLSGPAGVTVGPDGNLYISNQAVTFTSTGYTATDQNSILEYNVATGTMATFIDAAALQALAPVGSTFAPAGLAFGPDGNLYVSLNGGASAAAGTGAVIRFGISDNGGVLSYSGTNTTIATGLDQPTDMVFGTSPANLNTLYVSDSGADSIIQITHADSQSPSVSTFIPAHAGGLSDPTGLAWHNGMLYVVAPEAASGHGEVLRYGANGGYNGVFAKSAKGTSPTDAVFNSAGDLLVGGLGANAMPNLDGGIAEFAPTGLFIESLVSSRQFAETDPSQFVATQVLTSGVAPAQLTLGVGSRAPMVSAGGPYTIQEGGSLTLHATATDPNGAALTYSWNINGNDTFGQAVGRDPTLTWRQLAALGITTNGTYTVRVIVRDGDGQVVTSAPVTLTVLG
jgi:PKD domain